MKTDAGHCGHNYQRERFRSRGRRKRLTTSLNRTRRLTCTGSCTHQSNAPEPPNNKHAGQVDRLREATGDEAAPNLAGEG
ncbi:hypothetical protein CGZ80_11150 [Rhodopirellula sp. MGV]|nr:hypothetical protein CGZ80_11150 [Rhodopirellula sp. MGV]PNY34038.1 hypothetical protein C2E31_25395 [Rhodopirellula baltica]PNY35647.1 hypothetical protein C2E31_17070 [Rhodopirellula baltica]